MSTKDKIKCDDKNIIKTIFECQLAYVLKLISNKVIIMSIFMTLIERSLIFYLWGIVERTRYFQEQLFEDVHQYRFSSKFRNIHRKTNLP